jgi:CBS domain-containing protein
MAKLEDVMAGAVVMVSPEDTLGDVRDKMTGLDIGAIPVVDEDGRLRGIVSAEDLVTDYEATIPVSRVMNSPVLTLSPDSEAAEAARTMREQGCHHIVVTRAKRVVGIVSSFDLLRLIES